MRYHINFEHELPADALRRVLKEKYGVSPGDVYCGRIEDRSPDDPRPVAMFTPPVDDETFGWTLIGDSELADATGQTEQELAAALTPVFRVRALVDDHSSCPDRWILVGTDGGSGRVMTDGDAAEEGHLNILYALEPISGEPTLTVVPPTEWARW